MNRLTLLLTIAAALILSSCLSTESGFSKFRIYSVDNVTLRGENIDFTFTNYSEKKVSAVTFSFELCRFSDEDNSSDFFSFEKKIYIDLESFEKCSCSIDLKGLQNIIKEENDELWDDLISGNVYVNRFFPKEIAYFDNSLWKDQFGDWSF